MRWAGHVTCISEEKGVYRVLVGKLEGRRPLGRPRRKWVDNIGWISRRWDVGMWTGLGWPRIGTGGDACECGNEPSGSGKCGEFLD